MPMRMSNQLEEMYELAGTYAGDGARNTAACIAVAAALGLEDTRESRDSLEKVLPEIRAFVLKKLAGNA